MKKDVVIVGAGAAGLMCALTAGKRKRSVLMIEHMGRIAGKVRVSGGGKCNFTNLNAGSENYISRNRHFCKSALAGFGPRDFVDMAERHGIGYYEKEAGQLFCRGGSGEIIRMLQKECSGAGVQISKRCRIDAIGKKEHFITETNNGMVESESVVVATGGLSYPDLGATDIGLRIAKQFGLKITPLKPALVPLIFGREDLVNLGGLSGVSFKAAVSCRSASFEGSVLFTHRGLSGPAILQASLCWEKGDSIVLNLFPGTDPYEMLMSERAGRMRIENFLSRHLPARLARSWCGLNIESKQVNQYTERELREIAFKLRNWRIVPKSTEGYAKAEVTCGGVDTSGLSSKTMEARNTPGLFFVGEVVDVTGQLGGFNLQWAWSSGHAAGEYA
jgi:predicted Rossmann fold flavoprotein